MIIKPKTRGFICTTAHPEGCKKFVSEQIEYARAHKSGFACKKVLVIGASMGYGLSSRIAAAYSAGASTIGIIFDKEGSEKKPASAGWYNTAAFEEAAHDDGLYAKTINGDAFSAEIKQQTIDLIKKDFGKVDMVIYSLAAPRRTTADGTVYSSVLKTTEGNYTNKTIDLKDNTIQEVTIEPATEEEVLHTVKVMGGEDWMDWIDALAAADAIEENAVTIAFSYLGPEITHPIYMNGSIGQAKKHVYETSKLISEKYSGIKAYTSVNKALVTQSSSAIPVVPLYISILFKVMKKAGTHEGCIEQMTRLFTDKLANGSAVTDSDGFIRLDDYEMKEDIQSEVKEIWNNVTTENVNESADVDGYWNDFFALFGFGAEGVDYEADISPVYDIPSLKN
ncbi:MAG: trans-2-enoyl-CoA reductase family protein [Oscillospiraceae bacterium]|nr:trans-2-enoyl-CoA reductase family protein [Oscillospiraceae bacterium]MDD6084240.1 trans-2-enoyl-CoA reductase family protein [Oscillospiraceae bacterium]